MHERLDRDRASAGCRSTARGSAGRVGASKRSASSSRTRRSTPPRSSAKKSRTARAGEPRVQLEVAGEEADPAADLEALLAGVEAEHGRRAGRRPDEVEEQAHRRRLPGAVRAEEAEHLTAFDLEVQVEQTVPLPEVLRESARADGGVGRHRNHAMSGARSPGTGPGLSRWCSPVAASVRSSLHAIAPHRVPRLPGDPQDEDRDGEADDGVGARNADRHRAGGSNDAERDEAVDPRVVAVGDERRAVEASTGAEAHVRGRLVAEEADGPGDRECGEVFEWLRVDQTIAGSTTPWECPWSCPCSWSCSRACSCP